jgi:hypothetical protein
MEWIDKPWTNRCHTRVLFGGRYFNLHLAGTTVDQDDDVILIQAWKTCDGRVRLSVETAQREKTARKQKDEWSRWCARKRHREEKNIEWELVKAAAKKRRRKNETGP